jgi:hypothetical protein
MTTPTLLYWDPECGSFVPVSRFADTRALREIIDFDGMESGCETTARFLRLDVEDEEARTEA